MIAPIRPDIVSIQIGALPEGVYKVAENGTESSQPFVPELHMRKTADGVFLCEPQSGRSVYIANQQGLSFSIHEGDVVYIAPKSLRVILSNVSISNTLLVTERCDNFCKFCCQPPKDQDDTLLLAMAANAILAFDAKEIVGISGGEPLIYGNQFISFLRVLREQGNTTPLHILTNGRALKHKAFANQIRNETRNRAVTLGIPLYSILPSLHDDIVGADGAWLDTIYGLINASYSGLPIEIRFIPTKGNVHELSDIVSFVAKFIPGLFQISIMNLEPKGWGRKNWPELYISPILYLDKLEKAVESAVSAGVGIRLFNYPLCHLSEKLYAYADKSISDWKNYYTVECEPCSLKSECGGFFTSSNGKFLDQPRANIL